MKRRSASRAGFELSEYGLGAWALGGCRYGSVEETIAVRTCQAYVEAGGNLIDTARVYDASERVIGRFLSRYGGRDRLFIASKTEGGKEPGTVGQIRTDLEISLRELGTDYLDIYYLHQPPEDRALMDEALDEMLALKQEGIIRSIGASIKGPNVTGATETLCLQYIETGKVDFLQVVYSILRQKNREVIRKASERGIGVIARTTLESGLLTGVFNRGQRFSAPDQRARYDPSNLDFILDQVERIAKTALRPPYQELAHVAMRFALLPQETTSIIVGARTPDEVRSNLSAARLPALPDDITALLTREYGSLTEKANYSSWSAK